MIEWNRNVGSVIQLLIVLIFFISLFIKRKNLGAGINYFIIASGIVLTTDTVLFIMRLNFQYNSVPIYNIAVNLIVFFLYFLYFRSILEFKKSKVINGFLIIIFLTSYLLFAFLSEDFLYKFPFKFYFLEVVLLIINIFLVLKETFNSDKILNIKSYYPFWACIGLMSVYLGVTPLLIISNTSMEMMNINIFFIILFVVNVIGYSILITGIFFAEKNINVKK